MGHEKMVLQITHHRDEAKDLTQDEGVWRLMM